MLDFGRVFRLRPADCSVSMNVAAGLLAEQLDCTIDEALRVLQAKAGEDPLGLERVAAWVLARHALVVRHAASPGGARIVGCQPDAARNFRHDRGAQCPQRDGGS